MQKESRHTLYAECIRKQDSAIEKIINCHHFLFPDSPDKETLKQLIAQDISPYLIQVDPSKSPLQQQINNLQKQQPIDTKIQTSINEKQGYLQQYTQDYENSVQAYQEVQPQLKALVLHQHWFDGFRAIQSVQDKVRVAGNGYSLSKTLNAVLDALGCSLRASQKAVIHVVALLVKGATIPFKVRLVANRFLTR